MKLGPGTRLRSSMSDTEVIVVRMGGDDVELTCGAVPMVSAAEAGQADGAGPVEADRTGRTELGKRYVDEEVGLEVLCTKPGEGLLANRGRPLTMKKAKSLPSSD